MNYIKLLLSMLVVTGLQAKNYLIVKNIDDKQPLNFSVHLKNAPGLLQHKDWKSYLLNPGQMAIVDLVMGATSYCPDRLVWSTTDLTKPMLNDAEKAQKSNLTGNVKVEVFDSLDCKKSCCKEEATNKKNPVFVYELTPSSFTRRPFVGLADLPLVKFSQVTSGSCSVGYPYYMYDMNNDLLMVAKGIDPTTGGGYTLNILKSENFVQELAESYGKSTMPTALEAVKNYINNKELGWK